MNYSRNNDMLLCRLNDLKIIDENMSKYAPQERPKIMDNIQGNVGLNCIMQTVMFQQIYSKKNKVK